ncbi:MAG TPA: alpha/beta hydrolase, partial [Bacteroidota bacterium]|nr:alpha/beta hydrolase [Bacteroidota bacterium]
MNTEENGRLRQIMKVGLFATVVALVFGAGMVPGPLKTGYADVGQYSIYYEDIGSGEPLILIHDGYLDRRMWDGQFDLFSRWSRVIRYDLRNHGLSHGQADTFSYHQDLSRLMDALGIQKAKIMGLSLGGSIAIDFALMHPEKVSKLVLVSSTLGGYELKDSALKAMEPKLADAMRRKDINACAECFLRSWTDGPRRTSAQVDASVRRKVGDMYKATMHRWNEYTSPRPLDPPALSRLTQIHAPTLFVLGELDMPGIRDIAGLVTRDIPGAKKVTIKGA